MTSWPWNFEKPGFPVRSASLGVKTTLSYPDWIFGSRHPAAEAIKSSSWTVLAVPQSRAAGWLQDSRVVCQWRRGWAVGGGQWMEPAVCLSLAWGGTLVVVLCLRHAHAFCIFTQESPLGSKARFVFRPLFEVSRPLCGTSSTHGHALGFLGPQDSLKNWLIVSPDTWEQGQQS